MIVPGAGFIPYILNCVPYSQWNKIYGNINEEGSFGQTVTINSLGDTIVVGAPDTDVGENIHIGYAKVYKYIAGVWTQLGQTLHGTYIGSYFGNSASINRKGNIIAIASYGFGSPLEPYKGAVQVFKYVSELNSWEQLGQTLYGEQIGDAFGISIAMNFIGNTLLIGARNNLSFGAGVNNGRGYAKVFRYIPSYDLWTQIGDTILGDINSTFGGVVATNSSGHTIAVGVNVIENGIVGYVEVYKLINGSWSLHGQRLSGSLTDLVERYGESLSLNALGDTLVIGAWRANRVGRVQVFKYVSGQWIQLGQILHGTVDDEDYGHSVSINALGDIIAIGAEGGNRHYSELYRRDIGRGSALVFKYISDSWVQYGNTILGENEGDFLGETVGLDSDGSTMIIGDGIHNDSQGYVMISKTCPGHLTPYTWFSYSKNDELIEEFPDVGTGTSVSFNETGDIVAVGTPYNDSDGYRGYVTIYNIASGSWLKMGESISGENEEDFIGEVLSINETGDVIIISSYNGYAKVFKFISDSWVQQGSTLTGESSDDRFGCSVAINKVGDIITIGASSANNQSGYVKVYKFVSDDWVQQGSTLTGNSDDIFGTVVSINTVGNIIAIGSFGADQTGYVKVYKFVSNDWVQQGSTLIGDMIGDWFGTSLSLNSNGDIIVIGAKFSNDQTGYVKVYKFVSDDWVQQGFKLTGENISEYFGSSVSINLLGDIIAIGAYAAYDYSGYVRVFKLIDNDWLEKESMIFGDAVGDQLGTTIKINAVGDTMLIGIPGKNNYSGGVVIYKDIPS